MKSFLRLVAASLAAIHQALAVFVSPWSTEPLSWSGPNNVTVLNHSRREVTDFERCMETPSRRQHRAGLMMFFVFFLKIQTFDTRPLAFPLPYSVMIRVYNSEECKAVDSDKVRGPRAIPAPGAGRAAKGVTLFSEKE